MFHTEYKIIKINGLALTCKVPDDGVARFQISWVISPLRREYTPPRQKCNAQSPFPGGDAYASMQPL
jgi:hypothetical protein